MDVMFWVREKIAFIRQMYKVTSAPYIERIKKIKNKEAPFVVSDQVKYEDLHSQEPPFQTEHNEATESLSALRLMYISMLISVFHSYFKTWTKQSSFLVDETIKSRAFRNKGWFSGYSLHFKKHFEIDFESAPVNLNIIKELILARNNIEHKSSITSPPTYNLNDYKQLKEFVYIDEFHNDMLCEIGWIYGPPVNVSEEQLLSALSTIEKFSKWFNNELECKVYPSRKRY